jgi:hypothetical protein
LPRGAATSGSGIAGLLLALVTPRLAPPVRLRVKAFKLDAPPQHPVEEAPFKPVDERFPDSVRGAPWRTSIPSSLLAAKARGVELAYHLVCLRRQLLACSLYTHRYIHFRLNFIRTEQRWIIRGCDKGLFSLRSTLRTSRRFAGAIECLQI